MTLAWVRGNIERIREYKGDYTGWGQKLADALTQGRLKGVGIKTDYEHGVAGNTYLHGDGTLGTGRWDY